MSFFEYKKGTFWTLTLKGRDERSETQFLLYHHLFFTKKASQSCLQTFSYIIHKCHLMIKHPVYFEKYTWIIQNVHLQKGTRSRRQQQQHKKCCWPIHILFCHQFFGSNTCGSYISWRIFMSCILGAFHCEDGWKTCVFWWSNMEMWRNSRINSQDYLQRLKIYLYVRNGCVVSIL